MFKKFFYVCAGLLSLAAAYQLGVRSAGAASGEQVVAATIFNGAEYVVTPNGNIFARGLGFASNTWAFFRSTSVGTPPVAMAVQENAAGTAPEVFLYCGNGTVVDCDGVGVCTVTNVFEGNVPAIKSTWGSVKTRYR